MESLADTEKNAKDVKEVKKQKKIKRQRRLQELELSPVEIRSLAGNSTCIQCGDSMSMFKARCALWMRCLPRCLTLVCASTGQLIQDDAAFRRLQQASAAAARARRLVASLEPSTPSTASGSDAPSPREARQLAHARQALEQAPKLSILRDTSASAAALTETEWTEELTAFLRGGNLHAVRQVLFPLVPPEARTKVAQIFLRVACLTRETPSRSKGRTTKASMSQEDSQAVLKLLKVLQEEWGLK